MSSQGSNGPPELKTDIVRSHATCQIHKGRRVDHPAKGEVSWGPHGLGRPRRLADGPWATTFHLRRVTLLLLSCIIPTPRPWLPPVVSSRLQQVSNHAAIFCYSQRQPSSACERKWPCMTHFYFVKIFYYDKRILLFFINIMTLVILAIYDELKFVTM